MYLCLALFPKGFKISKNNIILKKLKLRIFRASMSKKAKIDLRLVQKLLAYVFVYVLFLSMIQN